MQAATKCLYLRFAVGISLILLLALGSSCATLFNPVTQNVPVTSRPAGGEVWVDGKLVGTAPIVLKLDTRTKHDVTVRRGDIIRTWQMRPHLSATGGAYLGAHAIVLVPATYCVVKMVEGIQFYQSMPSAWFDFGAIDEGIAVGCALVGLTPLVVDVTTNHLNELEPTEITVDFE